MSNAKSFREAFLCAANNSHLGTQPMSACFADRIMTPTAVSSQPFIGMMNTLTLVYLPLQVVVDGEGKVTRLLQLRFGS
jgi:hypothetical protein